MTTKKKRAYVVRCKKAVRGADVGLGEQERWRKGDLVTYEGRACRKLDKAHIYQDEDGDLGFPFEDILGNGICLEDYFEPVPVKVETKVKWV